MTELAKVSTSRCSSRQACIFILWYLSVACTSSTTHQVGISQSVSSPPVPAIKLEES